MNNSFLTIFKKKPAFIGYITAGQRGLDYTKKAAEALVKGGVDILEIGVPFSDPVADGGVIQAAMNDALSRSVDIHATLKLIKTLKKTICT